jgi:hypothetical protein
MNRLAVFPSNAVARWIDTDWLEREPDPERESIDTRRRTSAESTRGYTLWRTRLRYRPFERLLSLLA